MPSLQILSVVQLFMESTFYGSFVLLFLVSNVVLDKRYNVLKQINLRQGGGKELESMEAQRQELRFWRTLGSVMMLITTCHWAFGWSMLIATTDNHTSRVGSRMSFLRFLFEMLSVMIGDTLLLGRLWTVGGKRPIIIALPLLCCIGFLLCAIRLIILEVDHLLLGKKTPTDTQSWFLSTTVLTSCINLYSTGYIAWRAWAANTSRPRSILDSILRISSIMVESAAIYSIWTFILLVVAASDLLLWSVFLPIAPSLYGCTMMLISVRLGLGWAMGVGGEAAREPKPLMIQFAKSTITTDSTILGTEMDYDTSVRDRLMDTS